MVTKAAAVVFDRVSDPDFLADVRSKASALEARLKTLQAALPDAVRDVRAAGLLVGMQVDPALRSRIVEGALRRGVIVITAGTDVVRLAPPLTVSMEELMWGAEAVCESVQEAAAPE